MKKLASILLSLCISGCTIPIHERAPIRVAHTQSYTKANTYAANLENAFRSLETRYDVTTEEFQTKLDSVRGEYELFENTFQSNKSHLTMEEYRNLLMRREQFKTRLITNKVRYIETNNLPDERWGEQ